MTRGITLAPCGLAIEAIETEANKLIIVARAAVARDGGLSGVWEAFGEHSQQVPGVFCPIFPRRDGKANTFRSASMRAGFAAFRTDCPRKIFAERLEATIARPFDRRTSRLEGIVHHLGLAPGGRPGQSFLTSSCSPASRSNDTLLRVVPAPCTTRPGEALRVVGIDDWAWKRGHRYVAIICDLERRRIVDIVPDREVATVTTWLADLTSISPSSRSEIAAPGIDPVPPPSGGPQAIQVADRWHLMENASAAFLTAVRGSMRVVRNAVGADVVDPALLSSAELRQQAGWLRREQENAAILALAKQGISIKGKSSGGPAIRAVSCAEGHAKVTAATTIFRSRMSSLDRFPDRARSKMGDWHSI